MLHQHLAALALIYDLEQPRFFGMPIFPAQAQPFLRQPSIAAIATSTGRRPTVRARERPASSR